jgi:predicted nucleotidyltransferase
MTKSLSTAEIAKVAGDVLGPYTLFCLLLGSAGTPRFNDESDVDLAVFFEPEPTFELYSQLKTKIEERLEREVDLISLRSIDPIFSRQVLETGRELFCQNSKDLILWKARELSKYPDLKLSRANIETQLLNRKKYV